MPLHFHLHRKSKDGFSNKTQSRPLMYAQSSYAPSLADSSAPSYNDFMAAEPNKPEGYIEPHVPSATMTERFSPYRAQQTSKNRKSSSSTADRSDCDTLRAAGEELDFIRPQTPPKGSRYNAWESYRDLPPDHPVFRYPAELREKMYAKGVDPVVKAEMDKNIRGKVYGGPMNPIQGFKGAYYGMINQVGGMCIGGGMMGNGM